MKLVVVRPPVPRQDAEPGVDMPIIGTWAPAPVSTGSIDVDFDRKPVVFMADGQALVRKAGF